MPLTVPLADTVRYFDPDMYRYLNKYPKRIAADSDNITLVKTFVVYDPNVEGDRRKEIRRLRFLHKVEIMRFLVFSDSGYWKRYKKYPLPDEIRVVHGRFMQELEYKYPLASRLMAASMISEVGWEEINEVSK